IPVANRPVVALPIQAAADEIAGVEPGPHGGIMKTGATHGVAENGLPVRLRIIVRIAIGEVAHALAWRRRRGEPLTLRRGFGMLRLFGLAPSLRQAFLRLDPVALLQAHDLDARQFAQMP